LAARDVLAARDLRSFPRSIRPVVRVDLFASPCSICALRTRTVRDSVLLSNRLLHSMMQVRA
jgi:hypothetical protein